MRAYLYVLLTIAPYAASGQENDSEVLKAQKVGQEKIYQGTRLVGARSYDSNGNMVHSVNDGFQVETIRTSSTQRFNAQNQVEAVKATHSAMADTTFWKYQYNSSGKLIAVTNGADGEVLRHLDYSSAGLLLQELHYFSAPGKVSSTEKYTYDAQGRLVETTIDGDLIKERLVRKWYDANGREIKHEMFNKGKLTFTQLTEYGPAGEKSRVLYWENGEQHGVRYTHDDHKRLVSRLHFKLVKEREIITGKEEFTYLPSGLISSYAENINSFSHTTRSFSYKYN